ncbi:MAG: DUF445 family protein [Syntrophomonadaceae bacterium]|nr:DUF445 family protein [Syntrophomonadaceae bacterium]
MNNMVRLLVIPVISAFIGYLTNVVAIRMLFHPRDPISILGIKIQGLIPSRQAEMAEKIGEIVERELLSMDDLVEQISTPEMQAKMVAIVSGRVRERIEEVIPSLIPQYLIRVLSDAVEGIIIKEAGIIVDQVVENAGQKLTREIRVNEIVKQRVMSFEVTRMEKLVKEVASKELNRIEILGGVLGFIIGLVQLGILLIFP